MRNNKIGCKRKTREKSLVLEANTKRRMLYHAQVNEISYSKLSYLCR